MLKLIKKCFIIVICILIVCSLYNSVFAISEGDITGSFTGSSVNNDAKNTANNILKSVLSITRIVAAAIALIILTVIACKYIIASAGDRADIKKYAVNYIIGAIILFGASGILGIIKNFIGDITDV